MNSVCCRLNTASKSALATAEGWPVSANWRKLCNTILEHENSNGHRKCYLALRELEKLLSLHEGVEDLHEASIKLESQKWYNILKRIIDVTLLIGEHSLAFHSSSQRIGD